MKITILLFFSLFSAILPHSALHATEWTGLGDVLTWEDANNWDTGLPTIIDSVEIAHGATVNLNSSSKISQLVLGRTPFPAVDSTLIVTPGAILIVAQPPQRIPPLSPSRVGNMRGAGRLRLEDGSSATFWSGLQFGSPAGANATLDYFGSGASFMDTFNQIPMGIAPDADHSAIVPSVIRWNFHIDRSKGFQAITCPPLQLSTTTSAQPNSIRLDIVPVGTPFQIGDSFALVNHSFSLTGQFLTPDGSASIADGGTFTSGDTTFRINYNDLGLITATVTLTAPDTTPPTLDSFVDDQGGGSVFEGQTVTYTVTFSEAMNASTVKTGDFENAGAATITVDSVNPTVDPGIFQVAVTATRTGTLRLQVKVGVQLEDLASNALDTTTAIPDDTVITVNPLDFTPPLPDPMTFASLPSALGQNSITMTASTAIDLNGVEYFFEETSGNPGGNNSDWQDSPDYTDSELTAGIEYTYRVQARDKSSLQNETAFSSAAPATAGTPDTTPPSMVSVNPADGATGVGPGTNLVISFDESIALGTAGTVIIKDGTVPGETVITLPGPDPDGTLSISGADLTIDPAVDLAAGHEYFIEISATAVQDLSGNPFAGLLATDFPNWNFTTDGSTPVAPTFTSLPPPSLGNVGTAYSHACTASGTTPITFSVTSGALPAGLTMSSAGVISGTPSAAGTLSGTITASNGVLPDATQLFSIVIVQGPAIAIYVPNGSFEQIYKPGSTTITADLDQSLVGGGWEPGEGWTQGVGPATLTDTHQSLGTISRASYSDGTVGYSVDIPGWIGADRDGWIAHGGSYGRDQTTGNRQGSVAGQVGTPNGLYYYLANGGEVGWQNPAGGLIVSYAPLAAVESGVSYTLSMLARRRHDPAATPVVLDLLANGVALTPISSVSPVLSDEWQEFSRTYDAASLSGHLGESLTIQLGVDRGASGTQSLFDAVSLNAFLSPITEAIFSENFDGVTAPALPPGWTSGSNTGDTATTMWELGNPAGNPATGPGVANSPNNCIGTNIAGDYGFGTDIWLRTPSIDLTSVIRPTVSYSQFRDIETGFDFASVRVLNAGDDSQLGEELFLNIDGTSTDWEEIAVALPSEAIDQTIKLEFRFTSDELENQAGWYIDDVTVTEATGLKVKTFTGIHGPSLLDPISNLAGGPHSGSTVQTGNIDYHGSFSSYPSLPGLTGDVFFSILWEGWFDVTKDGPGSYTFGTSSNDGSVVYLDLNGNGDFADPGELIVDNNNQQNDTQVTGTALLSTESVRIVIGYYQSGSGADMRARFKKGAGLVFDSLDPINGTSGHFFPADPNTAPAANILEFGVPSNPAITAPAVISQTEVRLAVPTGTDLATLDPVFTLSPGATCDRVSGNAYDFTTPIIYTVTALDGITTKAYTVTVTIDVADTTPPAIVALTPADEVTGVAVDTNLVMTFDESIVVGTGDILIKNRTDGALVGGIPITSVWVSVAGSDLTIDPGAFLAAGQQYAIRIPAGAIEDLSGNPFAGITDDTTWNFTTTAPQPQPEITVESPAGTDLASGSATVDFGSITIGTSAEKMFIIKNIGTADLDDINISVTGPDAADFILQPATPLPIFSENFEAGGGGFTVSTSTGTDWTWGGPDSTGLGGTVSTGNGASRNCWGTNIGNPGYYVDPTTTCLRSPVIDLTGGGDAQLTFAEALDLEPGDSAVVNIIDAVTDTVIAAIYTATDSDISAAPWNAVPAIDLAAGIGQLVRIEWCLTGFGGGSDDYLGWYIDDIQISVPGGGQPTVLPVGDSADIMVTYAPAAPGPSSATLHIASNDADENPFDVILTGAGIAIPTFFTHVGGDGVIGDTTLNTVTGVARVPATRANWAADGGAGNRYSSLISPTLAVPSTGSVTLKFTHRYNFESGWDGGAVYVSVNGAEPTYLGAAAFSANSYVGATLGSNAWTGGEQVFYGKSTDYDMPTLTESVANLGNLTAGDTISIEFRGGWDDGFVEAAPNWEIGSVEVRDSLNAAILNVDFLNGPDGFTVSSDPGLEGPWTYHNAISRFEIDGDTLAADRYAPDIAGSVIDLSDANLSVVLLSGTLDAGETFTLFDLSGGTTLSGTYNNITLPRGTWDVSNLGTTGTITIVDPADILSFEFPGLGAAIVDQGAKTIAITMPNGTDVTVLAPTFTLAPGTTCDRVSGSTHDFTNPVIYTVTASDGITTKAYTVTVNVLPSSNAGLASLAVSTGTLEPLFDAATTSYSVFVPFLTTEIALTPTTEESGATVAITQNSLPLLPGNPIGLAVGSNVFEVLVTAGDRVTTETYTITVDRSHRTLSWDRGGDGVSWDDPDNWSENTLPGVHDNAYIFTGGEVVLSTFNFAEINSLDLQSGGLVVEENAQLTTRSHSFVGGSGGEPSTLTLESSGFGGAEFPGLIFGGPLGGDAQLNDYGSGASIGELGIDSMADDSSPGLSQIRWNFFINRNGPSPIFATDVTLETTGSANPNAVRLDIEPSGDDFEIGDWFTLIDYFGGSLTGRFLTPDGSAVIEDDTTFESEGYTYLIDYDDAYMITATVTAVVLSSPIITTEPVDYQLIPSGGTATITVEAIGDPAPDFQWHQGFSGDTNSPIPGATSSTFTTPALTAITNYWVRVSNIHGSEDSENSLVNIISSNADLTNLVTNTGSLFPTFDGATTDYSITVPHAHASIIVTPFTEDQFATVQINGSDVERGAAGYPIDLSVGSNSITTVVVATDGVTTKTYEITVTRAEQTVVWNGSGDGINWHDAPNWSFGLVPESGDDAVIHTVGQVLLPDFSYVNVRSLDLRGGELILGWDVSFTAHAPSRVGGAGAGPATLTISEPSAWLGSTSFEYLTFGGPDGGEVVFNNHGVLGEFGALGIDPMADHNTLFPSPIRWNFLIDRSRAFLPLQASTLALETVGSATPNAIRLDIMPSGDPFELNDTLNLATYLGGSLSGRFLTPDGLSIIGDDTTFESGGYTFLIDYDDQETVTATVTGIPSGIPVITTQPVAEQSIESGSSVTLMVEATADPPPPTYQWYLGNSGDTSSPIAGATTNSFTTPPLTTTASYWVRVSGSTDSVPSDTATVHTVQFANADLSNLTMTSGTLAPAFNSALTDYAAAVANNVTEVYIRSFSSEPMATIEVDGAVVSSGFWSDPIALEVGTTPITILVRAFDGTTTKTYTLAVDRLAPTVVATGPATEVAHTSTTVTGTVTPNAQISVYFEYGPDTNYGFNSVPQYLSGTTSLDVESALAGLSGGTIYHYRIVAFGLGSTFFGDDAEFTTLHDPPAAATGNAIAVSNTGATLVGAVNPHGLATEIYFEYGLTHLYGNTTPVEIIPAGDGLVDALAPVTGLLTGGTYHYRIVAHNAAGTDEAEDTTFVAMDGTSTGTGTPTSLPTVTSDDAWQIESDAAMLRGTVNGHGGTTVVWFEYGTSSAYGQITDEQGIGNSDAAATLSLPAAGLLPDTEYHYRVVGSNSLGVSAGSDQVFQTATPSPLVTTGETELVTTTSVLVRGTVRALNTNAEVWVDYGTSPSLLTNSVRATPASVAGNNLIQVSAQLDDLIQTVRYYYQVRAKDTANPAATGRGTIRNFNLAALSGLAQHHPLVVLPDERDGVVTMSLIQVSIAGGWRFRGERTWRGSGESATGLTTGDRTIEFRPVPGFLQPQPETVAVISGNPPQELERAYTPSSATGSGDLIVSLKPDALAAATNPVESRAQWRLLGETDAQWRDTSATLAGLVPGDYIIECKPVSDRTTPPLVTARVQDGQPTVATATYFLATPPGGTPPGVLSFPQISATSLLPYPFVGQIRSDVGTSTGFVIRPGVVATAGHVVFDDGTLASTTGLQWLFQRHRGIHEPTAQSPRGFYLLSGYAEQRAIEDTPGESSPESQNLDAAALYFLEDPGRAGFSGFLASDSEENEFLLGSAKKTLVGYPIDGISAGNLNRMHATPPADVIFAPAFGQTYTTSDISATGGNSGGPLCILHPLGSYYPAAIYLGGTGQTVVRAIDSDVLGLFGFAEASSVPGGDNTGGSATLAGSAIGTPSLGALEVFIEPAAARANGAGWRINSQANYEPSGARTDNLAPRTDYGLQFASVPGFLPPTNQVLDIIGGELLSVTFTYEVLIPPPVITSSGVVEFTTGEALNYQITATNSPEAYSLSGALPAGISFNPAAGTITGPLGEAGRFDVTVGASNAGGADNKTVSIFSRPVLANQEFTNPQMQPMSYQIVSGESGPGVSYAAIGLPTGLTLDPVSGVLSGTPETAGVYPVPITVTRREAGTAKTLTLNITGDAPAITLDLPAGRAVEYGLSALLTVAANGTPAPGFQWYQGPAGDDSNPVENATGATFTTPPITAPVSFWVRAISISGTADSNATQITVLPSANARLSKLVVNAAPLNPPFNANILDYTMVVPDFFDSVVVTPDVQIDRSSVEVDGLPVTPGTQSNPVPLAPGTNTITVRVTADDGIALTDYTISITRSAPPVIATDAPSAVDDTSATLHGTVTPNGPATVFFEYGPTPDYGKATPSQTVTGDSPLAIQRTLTALSADTPYHYRIVLTTSGGTAFTGADQTFVTGPPRPVAATSSPVGVTTSQATLTGAVIPMARDTTVYFEYGPTATYGSRTPDQVFPAGTNVRDVTATVTGLTPSAFYHCRIVATSTAGSALGEDIEFQAVFGTGAGDGIPDAPPTVTTGAVSDVTPTSVRLLGLVNPNDGTTLAYFEYGPTTDYGFITPSEGKGNGSVETGVNQPIDGLVPGALYHYRLVASNSLGESQGNDATFKAGFLPPITTTGGAEPITATSARITGTVRARGAATQVHFDYGTDPTGMTFPFSILAGNASGDSERTMSADLINLEEGITYYYRVRAISSGGTTSGEVKPLSTWILLGLQQQFSRELPPGERDGRVLVNLTPAGTGAWHFLGETAWRSPGQVVTGLLTGEREIEFQPVPGSIQPLPDIISVVSGGPVTEYNGAYYDGSSGAGALRIVLEPDSATDPGLPVSDRAQWRVLGHSDSTWRNSGDTWSGLPPGSHLIECKPINGREVPPPATIIVEDGTTSDLIRTYLPASPPTLFPPRALGIEEIATSQDLPYAFVGQIRSATGSYSGFVVKPRVVATVAQAIYDDSTLEVIQGLQWIHQRDHGSYEPEPQIPRGFYSLDNYAAQRIADDSPGVFSMEAQNANVAALYFAAEAGRGGFAGYLASDAPNNEYLESDALKMLVGYPVHGVSPANQGRMHSTVPRPNAFAKEFDRVYTTTAIRGGGGFIGGPLCVQYQGGSYYPAAIHLGGGTHGLVRIIDTSILDLFFRAAISANGGDNNTSGGISHTSFVGFGTPQEPGRLKISIEPAGALAQGSGWKLLPDPGLLPSGETIFGLPPGTYEVQFRSVPGYGVPAMQSFRVSGGDLTEVVFTYPSEVSELDAWRLTHFGPSPPPESADDQDPDRDGRINYDEFVAKTNPNDPDDYFRIAAADRTGALFTASLTARAGRRYELQHSTTLAENSWQTVAASARSISDGDAPLTLTDNSANSSGYYRVAVSILEP